MNVAEIGGGTFVALHYGHDNFRICCRDCEPDLSRQRRQTVAAFLPGPTAIRTLENAADVLAIGCGNTIGKTPWGAAAAITCPVDYFRIIRRHRNINTTHTRRL